MNIGFYIRNIRFHFGITRHQRVDGINSLTPDGDHFLMWDFDDVALSEVTSGLKPIQERFELSSIYILNTGVENFFHAYCFKRRSFMDAVYIIGLTPHVDMVFWRMGTFRGYFTLRFSPKKAREFKRVKVLISSVLEDYDPNQHRDFVTYLTRKG